METVVDARAETIPARADAPTLTERLAEAILRETGRGIDDATIAAAQRFMLDWLGCAIAGTATAAGSMLIAEGASRGDGPARALGIGAGRDAETAALVNGGLAHIVEMDDLDRASVVHPACVVIPAALAVAEAQGADGRQFLTAVVAGYEAALRVGSAVGQSHYAYWHNTATCGAYGAAVAAGVILGLSPEQLVWALGNAGSIAGGLWQFNHDGAMTKHLHAGRAAANGVLAARLAARGFTGARAILDGPQGLFAAASRDAKPELVAAGLDTLGTVTPWRIHGVSIKPHASCRHTHPAVDAALALRAELPADADAVVRDVQVETYAAALAVTNTPEPTNAYQAKFSLQYTVAQALRHGHVALADFSPERLADPAQRAFMPRVRLAVDPEFDRRYPEAWSARVRLTLADGAIREMAVATPKGDPETAVTDDELRQKFAGLLEGTSWAGQSESLVASVDGLADRASMAGWLPAAPSV
jgi:2-methylcitrate dehydratase PrpD